MLVLAFATLLGVVMAASPLGKPGSAAVSGGARGYVDTGLGEKFTVHVWATGSGKITLQIYNSRGIKVRDLAKDTAGGFPDFIEWDGANSSGKFLPSGVYPALVKAPGVRARVSLVIVRK